MSLHWLVLVFATICVSSHMHQVQSQLTSINPFRYSKWGFGACPSKITPMKDFDITKLYGQRWYLIAHYSEGHLLDRHCSDGNPGADICRVSVEQTSIGYDDGEQTVEQYFILLPNETDHATWIDTFQNGPSKSYVVSTDYKKYLRIHGCKQFPRENPFMYEQHNYILSTQAVWKGGLEDFRKGLDRLERMGIDTGPFILHDQTYCKKALQSVERSR